MTQTAIEKTSQNGVLALDRPKTLAERWNMEPEKLELIRTTCIAPDAPDNVLELYLEKCRIVGCDPTSKMLYCIPRKSNQKKVDATGREIRRDGKPVWESVIKWTFQSGIDLFRSIADSQHNDYAGQIGPFFSDDGEHWTEGVWLKPTPPSACKMGVLRHQFKEPLWAYGTYDYFCPRDRDGNVLSEFWKGAKGAHQLAKCVEALAIRKAFPQRLQGIYTFDEMEQAGKAEALKPAAKKAQQEMLAGAEHHNDEALQGARPALPSAEAAADQTIKPEEPAPLEPPSEAQILERFNLAFEGDPKKPKTIGVWLKSAGVCDLSTKQKVNGRYVLTLEERRKADNALQALEIEVHGRKQLQPQEPVQEAHYTEDEEPRDREAALAQRLGVKVPAGTALEFAARGEAQAEEDGDLNEPCEFCGAAAGELCKADCPREQDDETPQPQPEPDEPPENFESVDLPEGTSTRNQRAQIGILCTDLGISDHLRHKFIWRAHRPKWSAKHLDKAEASAFIQMLKDHKAQRDATA